MTTDTESERLYINNETLARESWVGTRVEWEKALSGILQSWYRDYLAQLDDDDDDSLSFENWREWALDKGLRPATDDDIKKYKRL